MAQRMMTMNRIVPIHGGSFFAEALGDIAKEYLTPDRIRAGISMLRGKGAKNTQPLMAIRA